MILSLRNCRLVFDLVWNSDSEIQTLDPRLESSNLETHLRLTIFELETVFLGPHFTFSPVDPFWCHLVSNWHCQWNHVINPNLDTKSSKVVIISTGLQKSLANELALPSCRWVTRLFDLMVVDVKDIWKFYRKTLRSSFLWVRRLFMNWFRFKRILLVRKVSKRVLLNKFSSSKLLPQIRRSPIDLNCLKFVVCRSENGHFKKDCMTTDLLGSPSANGALLESIISNNLFGIRFKRIVCSTKFLSFPEAEQQFVCHYTLLIDMSNRHCLWMSMNVHVHIGHNSFHSLPKIIF